MNGTVVYCQQRENMIITRSESELTRGLVSRDCPTRVSIPHPAAKKVPFLQNYYISIIQSSLY